MSRKKTSKRRESISLFPMISIMICVLGVIMLILSGTTLVTLSQGVPGIPIPPDTKPYLFEWNGNKLSYIPLKLENTGYALDHNDTINSELLFDQNLAHFRTWGMSYDYIQNTINKNPRFMRLFQDMKHNADDSFAMIFIRKSGYNNFQELYGFFLQQQIDFGADFLLYNEEIVVNKNLIWYEKKTEK